MLKKGIQREKCRYHWGILSLVLCLQLLVKGVRTDGEGFPDQLDKENLSRALASSLSPPLQTNGGFASSPASINGVSGYQGRYYSEGSFVGTSPNMSPGINAFDRAQNYNVRAGTSGYLVEDPYGSRTQGGGPSGNTYNVIYSSGQEKKIPLFLSKSPLVVNGGASGGGSSTRPSYNTSNRQEINKYFSPYSSIHYLSSTEAPNNGNSRWAWNHIEKPILRTSTARPVEFKHKVPNMDEAWWNVSYNVRKEPRRPESSESAVQSQPAEEQSTVSGQQIESSDSKVKEGSEDKAEDQNHNHHHKQGHNHGHNHSHSQSRSHSYSHKDGARRKDHEKDEGVPQEDELLKSATIGDIVNLTRLEVPNPYDRKVAIDQLISSSLENLKMENWSIPVEEIINATFIHPGTQQPDLVPNQMGPKVKVQDFYCNPQIHKCTNLHAVGTAIGEPIWKIYNTSTVGRAQRRVSNLLDDTEVSWSTSGIKLGVLQTSTPHPTRSKIY